MAKEKFQLKVRLILEDNNRILMLRQTSKNGGKHSLIGGTVDQGEFPIDALIREAREEAGLEMEKHDLKLVHTLYKRMRSGERIVMYFKARRWKGVIASKEPKKFKKVLWVDTAELPVNTSPTVKHILGQYKLGITYSEFVGKNKVLLH